MTEGTILPARTSVTELARLGRKKEIRELSRRLADLSPGGITLTNDEALALAQYSWSLGANPLVGEAWLLKNHKTGKVLGLMPGIRLHRRRADEKDERTNDARWIEYTNISDTDERATFAIPQNAMAIKARLYRQSTTKTYADAASKLADAGASWDDIKAVLGTKPYIEGIGILTKQEMDAMNRGQNKMPHKQRCEKRAEAHALKQAYHLPFGYVALSDEGLGISEGATLDEYIIEGSFTDVPDGNNEDPSPEDPIDAQRPYPADITKQRILDKTVHHKGKRTNDKQFGLTMGCLNLCFAGDEQSDAKRRSVVAYLFGVDSGKDLKGPQTLALLDWLEPIKDSGDAYAPSANAEKEAKKIVAARIKELGQEAMFSGDQE